MKILRISIALLLVCFLVSSCQTNKKNSPNDSVTSILYFEFVGNSGLPRNRVALEILRVADGCWLKDFQSLSGYSSTEIEYYSKPYGGLENWIIKLVHAQHEPVIFDVGIFAKKGEQRAVGYGVKSLYSGFQVQDMNLIRKQVKLIEAGQSLCLSHNTLDPNQ